MTSDKKKTWAEKQAEKVAELRAQMDAGTYVPPPQPPAQQKALVPAPRPRPPPRKKLPKADEVDLVARKIRLQEGEDAVEAAARRLAKLSPLAVRVLEHHMRTGTREQFAAAKQVLEANGLGKKDNGTQATAPIIILHGGAVQQPPWVKKEAKVIDVKVEASDEDS